MQTTNYELIYIGDPMCSWCWGISAAFDQLKAHFEDKMQIRILMGGLRPGGTETMLQMKDFLRHHWDDVYKASGQPFTYDVLDEPDRVYDTEPPSRAVVTLREMAPEQVWPFFKAVQHAFYVLNKDMNDPATYLELAEGFGVDVDAFAERMESKEMRESTSSDFAAAMQMGVRGFPSVVLGVGEQLYLVTNGYTGFEDMRERVERILGFVEGPPA